MIDLAWLAQILNFVISPQANSTDNQSVGTSIGNKQDSAQTTVGTTSSIIGYIKGLLNELAKVPKSDGTSSWNSTALAAIKDQADSSLNTEIPVSPVSGSINEVIKNVSSRLPSDGIISTLGTGDLMLTVAVPSGTSGTYVRESIGNKLDDMVQTVGTTASIMSYVKGLIQMYGGGTVFTYSTGGIYNWVCPSGIYTINVLLVGAGAGGYGCAGSNILRGPGGGGGAVKLFSNVPSAPYMNYQICVGTGGIGGIPPVPGGTSSFYGIGYVGGGDIGTATIHGVGGMGGHGAPCGSLSSTLSGTAGTQSQSGTFESYGISVAGACSGGAGGASVQSTGIRSGGNSIFAYGGSSLGTFSPGGGGASFGYGGNSGTSYSSVVGGEGYDGYIGGGGGGANGYRNGAGNGTSNGGRGGDGLVVIFY